tara:strand:- start:1409 stop:1891 length:483 start_codon:yes stop_codon:yes gene_type:complete
MDRYFDRCTSLNEAKKLYHDLLLVNHPDHGGSEEATKEIIKQFELFCQSKAGQQFDDSHKAYGADNVTAYADAMATACRFNIKVEIVGMWIWVTCTKEDRDIHTALKLVGFRFSAKHVKWYYNGLPSKKKYYRNKMTMNDIKRNHGSTLVQDRKNPIGIS